MATEAELTKKMAVDGLVLPLKKKLRQLILDQWKVTASIHAHLLATDEMVKKWPANEFERSTIIEMISGVEKARNALEPLIGEFS